MAKSGTSPYFPARTKNRPNNAWVAFTKRIQRWSPLRHIESPGDTSDVNVQQEKFEVLDNAFCEGKRGNVISSLMYSVLLHAKNLGGSGWGKNSFLKYLFIHTQFKLWWSTHECCNMLQRLRHISPITSITRRRIRICVDDPSKRITIIAPVWNECICLSPVTM